MRVCVCFAENDLIFPLSDFYSRIHALFGHDFHDLVDTILISLDTGQTHRLCLVVTDINVKGGR